ncbi:WXG100 family type VII secretion target [Amycolatopsis sp. NPDC059027]|uniref:WXG100 family type VII secretion target n=1 Tax=Amycolatopsis sp. NPDC059027 TaxID=3346709 RepID=UPI003671997F
MDGPGFHVDVEKVEEAASGIRRSVTDQENFELRGLCGDTQLYGHGGIHDALMNFCVRWSDGLDTLTDDAGAIGDVLARAAQAYRTVDQSAADSLKTDPGEGAVDGG